MKKLSPFVLGLSLAVAGSAFAAAQENASMPKVLQITREFIKPYKGGALHDKSESAFIQAMSRARWPTHYLALSSLSGKSRALYLTPYSSFEAWEKDSKAVQKNSALSAELERASVADGELLDAVDQSVCYFDDELSYRPNPNLAHARYVEATVFHVRPGHGKEWSEVVKMAIAANQKAGTSAHWSMWDLVYGGNTDDYIMLSADKSMADIDTGFAENKQFMDALGENGKQKFRELYGASVDTSDQELFAINPHQSYVSEDWIQADPDFWKPRPPAAPAAADKKPKP
jgi:hypothetical protein